MFKNKYTSISLLSMAITWVVVTFIWAGIVGGFHDLLGLAFYTGFLSFIAWLLFIAPFVGFINKKIMETKQKALLPIASGVYGALVFLILFPLIFAGPSFYLEYFTNGIPSITWAAAAFGVSWGICYLILYPMRKKKIA